MLRGQHRFEHCFYFNLFLQQSSTNNYHHTNPPNYRDTPPANFHDKNSTNYRDMTKVGCDNIGTI